jgi:hypothetical protein
MCHVESSELKFGGSIVSAELIAGGTVFAELIAGGDLNRDRQTGNIESASLNSWR